MSYVIRDAVAADLPAIRDIYNDAVLNTLAIWNENTVDLDNRQQWFDARQAQGYPILVIVDDTTPGSSARSPVVSCPNASEITSVALPVMNGTARLAAVTIAAAAMMPT